MNEKGPKETSQPPLLPTVSPGEIIELLKVQRTKGEELLKNSTLSPGDLQYWNLFTKEILIKAFGPSREYLDSILCSGEDKPLSVYEPESNLEKMRRENLQMTMRAMENCMEKLLIKGSPLKDAKNIEPQGLSQIPRETPSPLEEKDLAKELSAALPVPGESTTPETSQRVDNVKKTNERKVLVVSGPDEDRKNAVVFFLKKLDLEPFLVEGADGQASDLSQKHEKYAEATFAITLLTGGDMGFPKGKTEKPMPRPPQEAIFELGFLMGLLHPKSGCVLYEEGLDLPSGCKEISLIPYDAGGLWKLQLARAMKLAKINVDLNKAV